MQFITRFYHFTSWRVSIMKQTFTLLEHHISRILSLCACPSIISLVWYVLWTYIIFDSSSAISFFVLSSSMICSHLNNMQMNLQNRSNGQILTIQTSLLWFCHLTTEFRFRIFLGVWFFFLVFYSLMVTKSLQRAETSRKK